MVGLILGRYPLLLFSDHLVEIVGLGAAVIRSELQWMDANRYARLPALIDDLTLESIYVDLMHVMRTIFEPWEQHPLMLRSYSRARSGPGGKRLIQRGIDAVVPVAKAVLTQAEPGFAKDLELILTGAVYGFLARFAQGEIDVTEIVPGIERAMFRLTSAYENGSVGVAQR